ncbi:MAG: L,D-transpeptidase family protein [Deltaproteobacteria bacterium]|nr:L,D-transpeptidase family protein [Deltaproteobacteria bacterium]
MTATAAAGLLAWAPVVAVAVEEPAGSGALPAARPEPAPPRQAQVVVGESRVITAAAGDSLTSVAARFGLSVTSLARANALASDARLAIDQPLRIETAHVVPAVLDTLAPDAILVNVPQRMLFERRGGALAGAYPIAAGRPSWPTPLGEFTVDARAIDKPWFVPRRIQEEMRRLGKPVEKIVPPGPANPLGRHWLGLSRSSIGIHGTNAPASVHTLRTHGCIRLHPDDIAALYARTRIGDPVTIVYEPVLLAAEESGRLCLEAHPDAYHRAGDARTALERDATAAGLKDRIDWRRAAEILAAREGLARDVTVGGDGALCVPAN